MSEALVGRVQFVLWQEKTLDELQTSHITVGKHARQAKRTPKSQLGGKIMPHGNRVATGTKDSDTLLETVRGMAPEVASDIGECKKQARLNSIGHTSMNSFYCLEYIASA
ncbi:hypothetical protein FB451DRAFT_1191907 [Mycena latifolia]|nr:hypothetical protein FB451DRAFT_1191907 [Mycena latifolia]